MEWTSQNYEKLFNAFDKRLKTLDTDRKRNKELRHVLYKKRDRGELTRDEDIRLKEMETYEDGILGDINHLHELEEGVYEALNKLEENI